jgi:hypothetical protein
MGEMALLKRAMERDGVASIFFNILERDELNLDIFWLKDESRF